jgi:hypothetical protein
VYNEQVIVNWIEIGIGLWVLLSPWLLGFSDITVAKWSNVLLGLVLIVVNAWFVFEEGSPKAK